MSSSQGTSVDIGFLANVFSKLNFVLLLLFIAASFYLSLWFLTGATFLLVLWSLEIYFKYAQKRHAILRNYGIFGALRYLMESVGPELRQYWIASDTEEKPFSRRERGEVYQYSKMVLNTAPFGTLESQNYGMIRHSMYPKHIEDVKPFKLTFGEERHCENCYSINRPFIISGMSFGALGENAVRSLARGAKRAGIPMNTGEGGYPKHHLKESPDLIFQIGTAKFGVRNIDGTLNDEKLAEIAALEAVKMIELKLSQGAKPGKGGLLPAPKVTKEIAELRGVTPWMDVYSPAGHEECDSPESIVQLVKRIQDVSKLPVGIKLCIGSEKEFEELIRAMTAKDVFPDYISIDGAEGGTGAAPRSFLDYVGVPLFRALCIVNEITSKLVVRDKFKLLCAGKLINPAKQLKAFAYGADAVYTARGFMLSIGCIQALQCNSGECPVGITTHNPKLQRGLDIETKAIRVENYVENLENGLKELLAATGYTSLRELRGNDVIFNPWEYN